MGAGFILAWYSFRSAAKHLFLIELCRGNSGNKTEKEGCDYDLVRGNLVCLASSQSDYFR
jgi:hypothetical protein